MVLRSFFRFIGYFGNFQFSGVFWSFFRLQGNFCHFLVYRGCFGHFLCFGNILVIF